MAEGGKGRRATPTARTIGLGVMLALAFAATLSANARSADDALNDAIAYLRGLPATPTRGEALAAQSAVDGHWTLANRRGEIYTSANASEFQRGIQQLAPDVAKEPLDLYLTDDSLFAGRSGLAALPQTATLFALHAHVAYKLLRQGNSTRWSVSVRPGLLVDVGVQRPFDEALYQLARPIQRSVVRMLSLESGGPSTLSSTPRFDPSGMRALVDPIDPARLADALSALKGQTALISGRADGEMLFYQAAEGAERSVNIRNLTAAAEATDVTLVILKASSAYQSGGRNWLWQTVEVKGLDDALKSPVLSDFLASLTAGRTFTVTAVVDGGPRTTLDLTPRVDTTATLPTLADVSGKFSELTGHVTGQVTIQGISVYLRSSSSQTDLDRRVLPQGLNGWVLFYLTSALAGVLGLSVSRAWWVKLWPTEARGDFGNATGYGAARAIRACVFVLVFLPLTGYASMIIATLRAIRSPPTIKPN
jgi:hypothetical protein